MKKLKLITLLLTLGAFLIGCSTDSDQLEIEATELNVEIEEFDGAALKKGNLPSARGFGTKREFKILPDGTLEPTQQRFVFTAITKKNGEVEGNAVFNRPEGQVQIDINCIRYGGIEVGQSGREYKRMVLSGVVKRSGNPFVEKGNTAWFILFDGGDRDFVGSPSDLGSENGITCNSGVAQTIVLVNKGNIEIKIDEE
jgi:hypothetical protein